MKKTINLLIIVFTLFALTLHAQEIEEAKVVDQNDKELGLGFFHFGAVGGYAFMNNDMKAYGLSDAIVYGGEAYFRVSKDAYVGADVSYFKTEGTLTRTSSQSTITYNASLYHLPISIVAKYSVQATSFFHFEIVGGLGYALSELKFESTDPAVPELSSDDSLFNLKLALRLTFNISHFYIGVNGGYNFTGGLAVNGITSSDTVSHPYAGAQLGIIF